MPSRRVNFTSRREDKRKQSAKSKACTAGAVVVIMVALLVGVFIFISVQALTHPGGYGENTWMYAENTRNAAVQTVSENAYSLGVLFPLTLVAVLLILVILFGRLSMWAFAPEKKKEPQNEK